MAKSIGFVKSGMFQYYVLVDGEERTTYINIENTFLASVSSFVHQQPARENIRALTDGTLSLISRPNLKALVAEVPGFKDFYIALLEHTVCGIDASRHDLIVLSAEERYAKMLREEPLNCPNFVYNFSNSDSLPTKFGAGLEKPALPCSKNPASRPRFDWDVLRTFG